MDAIPHRRLPLRLSDLAVMLTVLLCAGDARAQSVVGRVVDASSGAPIPTAEVALLEESGRPVALGVTDSTGWFRLSLAEAGVYQLAANGPGYEELITDSVQVGAGEELALELRLGPRPFDVTSIQVVTRRMVPGPLRDFYWRAEQHKKTGRGIVVDRVELEQFTGLQSRRVLAQQAFVKETIRGGPARILVKRRLQKIRQGAYCEPDYFVDGNRVDAMGVLTIPASDLEGIEIYRGVSEVPPNFQRSSNAVECGVILAWTRRG